MRIRQNMKKEPRIPFTQTGYNKVLGEKQKLLDERPDAVENLRKSREMGDLSENGYYRASRARLSYIDARLRSLERLVKLGIIVPAVQSSDTVEIGNTVTISDGKKEFSYMIVGGYESNPSNNTISHISPLGKALMGKKKLDVATMNAPAGLKTYTILDIS